jgi:hypothetical protein
MAGRSNTRAGEIWKAIPGHKGYEVSNLGQVRSIDREVVQIGPSGGVIGRRLRGKVLKLIRNGNYLRVSLGGGDCGHNVHSLVLRAFVGKCPPRKQACHNNGNPEHNRLDNLRYDTPRGNSADKLLHGTQHRGERHISTKLTEKTVREIRCSDLMGTVLAKKYGVSTSQICDIRKGKSWTWLK